MECKTIREPRRRTEHLHDLPSEPLGKKFMRVDATDDDHAAEQCETHADAANDRRIERLALRFVLLYQTGDARHGCREQHRIGSPSERNVHIDPETTLGNRERKPLCAEELSIDESGGHPNRQQTVPRELRT